MVGLTADPSWEAGKIKMIRSCRNSAETTESRLILLAVWMKSRYGSTMAQALRTVFPIKARMDAKEKKIIVLRAGKRQKSSGVCGRRRITGQGSVCWSI